MILPNGIGNLQKGERCALRLGADDVVLKFL